MPACTLGNTIMPSPFEVVLSASAVAVLVRVACALGTAAFALEPPRDDQRVQDRGGAAAFDPASYPPTALDASLENLPGPMASSRIAILK